MTESIWALLPIKSLSGVKSRLATCLTPDERAELVAAMAEDVVSALKATSNIAGIAIVTHDADVEAWAEGHALTVINDSAATGLSEAVDLATHALRELGATAVLSILADTPRTSPEEIDACLKAWETLADPGLLLVPSRDGDGSNAMIFRPGSMGFHYGVGSAEAHKDEAKNRGLVIKTLDLRGFGLDIDTPGDLQDLIALEAKDPGQSRTALFLTKHEIAGRFQ